MGTKSDSSEPTDAKSLAVWKAKLKVTEEEYGVSALPATAVCLCVAKAAHLLHEAFGCCELATAMAVALSSIGEAESLLCRSV